jgi:hypothetical protein
VESGGIRPDRDTTGARLARAFECDPACPGFEIRSEQEAGAITIEPMTTKERLHKLVNELSEREADETLRLMAARRQGSNIDGWAIWTPRQTRPPR